MKLIFQFDGPEEGISPIKIADALISTTQLSLLELGEIADHLHVYLNRVQNERIEGKCCPIPPSN